MTQSPASSPGRFLSACAFGLVLCAGLAAVRAGDAPAPALLVLHKGENAMAIVDPETGHVVGRAPTGRDPHELALSERLKTGRGPDGMAWLLAKRG
jgi:hypothetical protein